MEEIESKISKAKAGLILISGLRNADHDSMHHR